MLVVIILLLLMVLLLLDLILNLVLNLVLGLVLNLALNLMVLIILELILTLLLLLLVELILLLLDLQLVMRLRLFSAQIGSRLLDKSSSLDRSGRWLHIEVIEGLRIVLRAELLLLLLLLWTIELRRQLLVWPEVGALVSGRLLLIELVQRNWNRAMLRGLLGSLRG